MPFDERMYDQLKEFDIHDLFTPFCKYGATSTNVWSMKQEVMEKTMKLNPEQIRKYSSAKKDKINKLLASGLYGNNQL